MAKVPLLLDAFFNAMAVTIMGGLTFATILTLIVVPVLYCTFWRITAKTPARQAIYHNNEETALVQSPLHG